MQVIVYVLFAIASAICTVLNYRYKDESWYLPALFLVCNCFTALWFWLTRYLKTDQDMLVAGLIWDAVLTVVSLVIPLIFYKVQLDWRFVVGLGLVVVGLVLLKVR